MFTADSGAGAPLSADATLARRTDTLNEGASLLTRYGLVTVVALAGLVRLFTLATQSAWLDEGSSIALARHSLSFILSFVAAHDVHPPLYYLVLHAWLGLFGADIVQARLLSLLGGIGSVIVLYKLVETLFDRLTATWVGFLFALSPLAAWYANEARMYSMSTFLSLSAVTALVTATRRDRTSAMLWLSYVVLALAAIYTDYSSGYLLVGGAAYALIMVARRRVPASSTLGAQIAIGLLSLPALLLLRSQLDHNSNMITWIPGPTPQSAEAVLLDLVNMHSAAAGLAIATGLLLALLSILTCGEDSAQSEFRSAYIFLGCALVGAIGVPLVASLMHPVFLTRTVLGAVLPLLIFFGRGIAAGTTTGRLWAAVPATSLVLLSVFSLNAAAATSINEDWRGVGGLINAESLPQDAIMFDQGYLQLPFNIYVHSSLKTAPVFGYPTSEGLLNAAPSSLRTSSDVLHAAGSSPTVWFVARSSIDGASPVVGVLKHRYTVLARYHFTGLTVTRLTILPGLSEPHAAGWISAATSVIHRMSPHSIIVVRGIGHNAFLSTLQAYAHPTASIITYDQATIARQLRVMTTSIVPNTYLATLVEGTADPAGIANNWLYQRGLQQGPMMVFGSPGAGQIRLYAFANGWPAKRG